MLKRREEAQATDQQVAVEKQSISEEMCTLRMGKAITTKAMGRWRCVRTEEEGGCLGCSTARTAAVDDLASVHTHVYIPMCAYM